MLPTFAEFAGATPEPGFVYDGVSAREVFTGKEKSSPREWILAMGSHPGLATDGGIKNVYVFRDRAIRETRYKLFVGTDRKPEKLVDVINDPEEKINLMGNPEYRDVLERLSGVIATLPKQDNDPIYTPIPDYPKYKTQSKPANATPRKSKEHKAGHGSEER